MIPQTSVEIPITGTMYHFTPTLVVEKDEVASGGAKTAKSINPHTRKYIAAWTGYFPKGRKFALCDQLRAGFRWRKRRLPETKKPMRATIT